MSPSHIQGIFYGIHATVNVLDLGSNKFKAQLPNLSLQSILYLSNKFFLGSFSSCSLYLVQLVKLQLDTKHTCLTCFHGLIYTE